MKHVLVPVGWFLLLCVMLFIGLFLLTIGGSDRYKTPWNGERK